MTCEKCGGTGRQAGEPQPDSFGVYTPCDNCEGTGRVECDRLHCNDTIGPCDDCPGQKAVKMSGPWTIYVCPNGHYFADKRTGCFYCPENCTPIVVGHITELDPPYQRAVCDCGSKREWGPLDIGFHCDVCGAAIRTLKRG